MVDPLKKRETRESKFLERAIAREYSEQNDAYLKIIQYLLYEKNFNFVLLGKIQTGRLEERFGKYRWYLAGFQYPVSLRQVYY
jgi:hypothetical protein